MKPKTRDETTLVTTENASVSAVYACAAASLLFMSLGPSSMAFTSVLSDERSEPSRVCCSFCGDELSAGGRPSGHLPSQASSMFWTKFSRFQKRDREEVHTCDVNDTLVTRHAFYSLANSAANSELVDERRHSTRRTWRLMSHAQYGSCSATHWPHVVARRLHLCSGIA